MFSNDAAQQMKIAIDSTVIYNTFAGAVAANVGATAGVKSGAYGLGTPAAPVTLSGTNILQILTSFAGVLDEQNVPETDRFLIIDPVTRQLLMQSNLAQAQFHLGTPVVWSRTIALYPSSRSVSNRSASGSRTVRLR